MLKSLGLERTESTESTEATCTPEEDLSNWLKIVSRFLSWLENECPMPPSLVQMSRQWVTHTKPNRSNNYRCVGADESGNHQRWRQIGPIRRADRAHNGKHMQQREAVEFLKDWLHL